MKPCIVVTSGEPAGIGPDLCLQLARATQNRSARVVILGDQNLLEERAKALGYGHINWRTFTPKQEPTPDNPFRNELALEVLNVPLIRAVVPGQLDPANVPYVLSLLDQAVQGCRQGIFQAMVTMPIHKGVINQAGIPFYGHTEYLREKTQSIGTLMLLVGGGLRVALATTHVALREVPDQLTVSGLLATMQILTQGLERLFGLSKPRLGVCGLNPHAGEGGYLGREEIEVISPAIQAARGLGIDAEGPLAADSLFVPENAKRFDAILAMYHDQGLAPLKYASFGHGVNVTLGLPLMRTSVDHGTALSLAATGRASATSLLAALDLAIDMAKRPFKAI